VAAAGSTTWCGLGARADISGHAVARTLPSMMAIACANDERESVITCG